MGHVLVANIVPAITPGALLITPIAGIFASYVVL